jgi:hypothetical protein
MAYPNRATSVPPRYTSERTAREVFFATLGAASVCLMLGLAAVGHFVS